MNSENFIESRQEDDNDIQSSGMKPLVVLAGHIRWKIERLRQLYQQNKPDEEHDFVLVYNGEDAYDEADIYCQNDSISKDIGMYYEAVKRIKRPFYFFMNDDIVFIKGSFH